jgi:hypothetical protein
MSYLKKFNGILYEDIYKFNGTARSPINDINTIHLRDIDSPLVTLFVIPDVATSLTLPITSFTAFDYSGVTGYKITESSTPPASGDPGWTASAPATYTFSTYGAKTLYAWAKDGSGNVSQDLISDTTTLSDVNSPVVTAFIIPATGSSLTVAITTFTATDNVGVTGYKITESSTPPAPGAAGWTVSAPTSYVFTSYGTKTLYGWAKDVNGNVSSVTSSTYDSIVLTEYIPPTIHYASVTLYPTGDASIQLISWPSGPGYSHVACAPSWNGSSYVPGGGMVANADEIPYNPGVDIFYMTNPGLGAVTVYQVIAYGFFFCFYTGDQMQMIVGGNYSPNFSINCNYGSYDFGAISINPNNLTAGISIQGGKGYDKWAGFCNFYVVVNYYWYT